MVEFITGEVVERGENFVVLKCGNFGIKVLTPSSKELSGQITLFTQLILPAEGSPTLYGSGQGKRGKHLDCYRRSLK